MSAEQFRHAVNDLGYAISTIPGGLDVGEV